MTDERGSLRTAGVEPTRSPALRGGLPAGGHERSRSAGERWRRMVLVAVCVILGLSAGLRLWHLSSPPDYMFDEVYYAKDARAILDGRLGQSQDLSWEPGDVVSWPHPDVGKLAIAAGIALAGDRPLGWRLPAAVAGLLLLACVYPLARRLGLSRGWALAALSLAAADTLGIAQSRIATLDVFVGLWTTVTVLCALRYVQEGRKSVWLVLAGLAGGLAVATKWSGALALFAAALVLLLPASLWGQTPATPTDRDLTGRSAGGGGRLSRVLLALACLVLLPAMVYFASYAPYFAAGHTWADWRELHDQMLHFNLTLSATHSYASAPPTWLLDYRPVWYSFVDEGGKYFGVVALGNPLLWWAATAALLAAPVAAIARGRTTLLGPAVLAAAVYFPWFAATRTSFLYYMTPVAPFLAILVAAALAALAGQERFTRRECRAAVALGALAFAIAAIAWYPVGRFFWFAFWELPGRVAPGLAVAVTGLGIVAAASVLALLGTKLGRARLRLWAASIALGAMTGIAVAFLPIVLNVGMDPDRFYRLIWFKSWI